MSNPEVERNRKLIKFINKHSTKNVYDRGVKLFNQEKVHIVEYDGQEEAGRFIVIGTGGHYKITFFGNKSYPKTECNCPYDWTGLCKHEVAVLLTVLNLEPNFTKKENTEEVTEGKKQKKSKKATHHEVELKKARDLQSYLHANNISLWSDKLLNANLLDISINQVSFQVSFMGALFNNQAYDVMLYTSDDNKAMISCTCGSQKDKLCSHQITALRYAALNEKTRYFFHYSSQYPELKDLAMKQYGLSSEQELQDEFYLDINEDGEYFFAPINPSRMMALEYIDENITDINEDDSFRAIMATGHKEYSDDPEIVTGYIICLMDTYDLPPIVLKPICGKTTKKGDKISKNVKELPHIPDNDVKNSGEIFFKRFEFELVNRYMELDDEVYFKELANYHEYMLDLFKALQNKLVMQVDQFQQYSVRQMKPLKVIGDVHPTLFFKITETENFFISEAFLKIEDEEISLNSLKDQFGINPAYFLTDDGRLYVQNSVEEAYDFFKLLYAPDKEFPKSDFEQFFKKYIEPLNQKYPVEMNIQKDIAYTEPEKTEKKLYLSELDKFILFSPAIDYGQKEIELFKRGNVWINGEDKVYQLIRDEETEEAFKKLLTEAHPNFKKQVNRGMFYLTTDELMENMWFFNFFENLENAGVKIYGREKLKNFKMNLNKPNFKVSVKSGIDWFDTEVDVQFGEQKVPIEALQKAAINKSQYVKLDDGTIGLLPEEWLEKLTGVFQTGTLDKKKEKVRHSKAQFNIVDKLHDEIDSEKVLREIEKKKQKLTEFDKIRSKQLPKKLKADLRDYQRGGYNWMLFLNEFGFGGCLADDMGLGKTLQLLTLLQKRKEQQKGKGTSMIVIPNSLVFNWQEEARKFTPELTILIHHGSDRDKDTSNFNDYDIVLTTYGTIVNDIEFIKDFTFDYAVLDESQAIKNPTSQRFKAVTLIQAKNRLTLTGTPIENNTYDLYAQMQFLNPGLLGNQAQFKKRFSDPIDKEGNEEASETLRTLIHPFILRRTKEKVAKELPEKSENILYCEMRSEQKSVYEFYRKMYRDKVLGKIEEDGLNKSKMHVLEALNKLRQVCNSPALLKNDNYANHSVKLEMLKSHVAEYKDKHKILVFSQFVEMLNLVKRELEDEGITYAYLDGQTKNRQKVVESFQNDESCKIFLISLKAGGQGLNLTAADYVYLIDPWWNPAVESQAIDRTYRIGQNKNVFAYKMICSGTIEEKIVKLQENKQKLSSELVKTEDSFVKKLKKEDIKDLFA